MAVASVGSRSCGLQMAMACSISSPKSRTRGSASIPMPLLNPPDPFLSELASAAAASPDPLLKPSTNSDTPPYLDLFENPKLMATPAQVERAVTYIEHRPRKPPPDLPSLLLHGRIVYIGMPEVGEEDMQGFQQQTTCSSMAEKGVIPGRRRTPEKSILIKGQWTPDEDELLASLVAEHGLKSWSLISKRFIGRVGKQCRDRWYNHLHPDIKKDSTWTEEEEKALIKAHEAVGNRWTEIAKSIPGRTENSVKNHWNATKRRQLSKKGQKAAENGPKKSRSSLLEDYIRSKIMEMEQNNESKGENVSASDTPSPPLVGHKKPLESGGGEAKVKKYCPVFDEHDDGTDFSFLLD